MERLRALPGVTAVGVVNNIPLDEGTGTGRFLTDSMSPESGGALLDQNFAGGDYFRVMGIDVLRGRPFTPDEAFTPTAASSSVNPSRRGCGPIGIPLDSESAAPATRRSGSPLSAWWRTSSRTTGATRARPSCTFR
jgi:hypothetical protein